MPGEPTRNRVGCSSLFFPVLKFAVLAPDFQGEEEMEVNQSPMAYSFTNHTYAMKAPLKKKREREFRELLGWGTRMFLGATMLDPNCHKDQSPFAQDLKSMYLI